MCSPPACECVSWSSPFTLPVTRGNDSWEIKALSCHNERLQQWRDLSPMKREGQDRKRAGEKKKRENIRGSGKWRSEALKRHPNGVSPFSSVNSIKQATDCHWQMLHLSSLSLAFPASIVKPTDQGVNTGLPLQKLQLQKRKQSPYPCRTSRAYFSMSSNTATFL